MPSQSAKLYQERKGLRPTRRGPGPQLALNDNKAHDTPMEPPLPTAQNQRYLNGTPSPDDGRIGVWPSGEVTIV